MKVLCAVAIVGIAMFTACTSSDDDVFTGTGTDVRVVTVAGDGTAGLTDGVGTAAQFDQPDGVTVNKTNGLIIVGDTGNNAIRTVTPDGTVATLAGNGTPAFADGDGADARFNQPDGVAVDSSGNVYVADTGNNRIRKITPGGTVTTIAGDGTADFKDDNGTSAQLNGPTGITVDSSGIIFVADSGNNVIRRIDSAGNVTTVAGDIVGQAAGDADSATGTDARFKKPHAVTVDSSGNLYVTDHENNKIKKITPGFAVSTYAGDGTAAFLDGVASASRFNRPHGLTVDGAGNIVTGDELNNRIRFITPSGVVQTYAGNGTAGYADGSAASAQFKQPRGIALDTSGNILICDYDNNRIRKIVR